MNLLFVCSKNQWRSPTAEKVWHGRDGIVARSGGTARSARHTVNLRDIVWADLVFAMEQKHKSHLQAGFRQSLAHKTVHVLDIPDDYRYMDGELVALLEDCVGEYL